MASENQSTGRRNGVVAEQLAEDALELGRARPCGLEQDLFGDVEVGKWRYGSKFMRGSCKAYSMRCSPAAASGIDQPLYWLGQDHAFALSTCAPAFPGSMTIAAVATPVGWRGRPAPPPAHKALVPIAARARSRIPAGAAMWFR